MLPQQLVDYRGGGGTTYGSVDAGSSLCDEERRTRERVMTGREKEVVSFFVCVYVSVVSKKLTHATLTRNA
jgi:hypothetical protein